jgi:hypothetical protein
MAKKRAAKRRSLRLRVIDLKSKGPRSVDACKKLLQEASKRKIAIVVLNAPFKLAA